MNKISAYFKAWQAIRRINKRSRQIAAKCLKEHPEIEFDPIQRDKVIRQAIADSKIDLFKDLIK